MLFEVTIDDFDMCFLLGDGVFGSPSIAGKILQKLIPINTLIAVNIDLLKQLDELIENLILAFLLVLYTLFH